jgi:hypothetical protein
MRANTRHQLREWRWVLWFLTIGWWYFPAVFAIWALCALVKLVIVILDWTTEEVKWILKS